MPYARAMDAPTDDDDDRDPFAPLPPAGPLPPAVPAALPTIRELALAGFTDAEIADRLGLPLHAVTESPDVLGALGPAHDERVARALYARAVGGIAWREQLDKFGDKHRLRETLAPDPKAALAWLQTRQRDAWSVQQSERVVVVVARAGDDARVIEHDDQVDQA